MTIDATCPNCQRLYRLGEAQLGKRVRCKGCQETFVVAAEEDVPTLEEASDADVRRAERKKRRDAQEVEVLEVDAVEEVVEDDRRVSASRSRGGPRRSRDEDDEDDRPRRSRRDEDDEEEEEPAKKGGGGLLLILGVVGGLLFLVCAGGGGAAYYAAQRAGDNIQAAVNNPPDDPWKQPDQDKGKQTPPIDPNKDGGKVPNPPINDGGKVPNPPVNAQPRDVNDALALLKDADPTKKRAGLTFLNAATVEAGRVSDVEKAVEPIESDFQLGSDAGRVLDRWAPAGKLARLTKLLDNPSSLVYLRAMDGLCQMKEEKAAEVLAGQLTEPGRDGQVVKYLPRMGKLCEKFVLTHYNSPNSGAQTNARRVLDQISTANDVRVRQCSTDLDTPAGDDDGARTRRKQKIIETLQVLKPTKEADLNEQVSKQLETSLTDANAFVADAAFKAMETWMTKDSVPAVIGVARKDVFKRDKAIKLVIKFPEHDSVPAFLVTLLPDGTHRLAAGKALIDMGNRGEKAILDVAKALPLERDVNARRAAYQILDKVGTKASLTPLAELVVFETTRGDKTNAAIARTARTSIQRREGVAKDPNPPKDKDKTPPKDKTPAKDKDKTMPKDKAKIKDKIK